MSIRTRFEIETFLLGSHPTNARKAQALTAELEAAKANQHPDLPVIQAVYDDFAAKHDMNSLMDNIEAEEEQYWIEKLARLAAIDILTIGKVQPETMHHMVAMSDEAFAASVKTAATLAKTLNEEVRQIEAELGADLVED